MVERQAEGTDSGGTRKTSRRGTRRRSSRACARKTWRV